ncbi:bestrophin family protein [Pseudomonas plecoglossicida]|uniref:bestrophin family protein n=1 Tax=Pseudomonas TaxID=286 RepID=UPI0007613A6F|nr:MULTISPECIES: bestrophin family protein [Pseudomonas]MDQ7965697.1 bestrophin family protein [Pseudomonas plecoglossicida]WBM47995.1 bestrophin family protein [Pseudomonas putida]WFG04533.1 bestrophin family protein [Pseudomonas putida]
MIVPPSTDVLRVLFTLKGSIVKRIALRCLMVTLLAALIVLVERHFPTYFYPVSATPFTLLGLSLSIFMSFRNNACYDRWWEGRKAWGKLIIETRSFVRESVAITDETLRTELLRNLCGFAHALNARLRNEDERAAARPWLARADAISPHNVCDGILREIGEHCSRLAAQQQISEWRYNLLEQRLVGLTEVQATCERIKGTPLPFPYTLLLHRTIYIFCLLLPFALAEPLGWLAPLFTTIVGYTFFGLDAIGNELEDPFGRDENDLPTDAMVRTVERDVLAGLGEQQLPPALLPVGYVLS